ncbi:MAG: hypothetical protein QOG62_2482 [Thermoleophilaceae bacterium]|nr:hypothetical protein [Thermoleophilaceae bacterium]
MIPLHRVRTGLALAAAFLALPASASAATLTVNDDSTGTGTCASTTLHSLQAGIDAATNGDTINVCAGTYNAAGGAPAANVGKKLTINGAQAGVDARSARSGAESVVNDADGGFLLAGGSDGSTVDGFTVQGVTTGTGAGIAMPAGNDDRILNNIVTLNTIGISVNSDGPKDTVIRQNRITNNNEPGASAGSGIYGDAGVDSVLIDKNVFTQQTNAAVIFVGPGNSDVGITGNSLGDSLVYLQNSKDVDIARNINAAPQFHAVQLDGGNSNVDIHNNGFTANNDGWSAIRVSDSSAQGDNSDVSIRSNALTGPTGGTGAFGINVSAYEGQLHAAYNSITGFVAGGINNSDANDTIDARNNWFGCNDGPGQTGCDTVTGSDASDVDVTPFLVLGVSASPATIKAGGESSTVSADLLHNSAGREVDPDFPNGVSVAFTTTLGTLGAATATTKDGVASATLTSGAATGTATVAAKLNSATVTTPVTISAASAPPAAFKLDLTGKGEQKPAKLKATATCSEACSVALQASGKAKGGARFQSRVSKDTLTAGQSKVIPLSFKKKQLKAAESAKKLKIKGAANASGNRSSNASLRVTVK